ncbi:carbonyl reductase [NADPH] 1 isoform X2 [Octopus bimaculoides]|uniref:carbonyl reductase (NADPH) n=1 Tax=Octopus bimaculoides TaxID=37653 RepID=A0A0L8HQM9_OCTBM|nr:carbonyl reductase [NADPH] 1 isoform X1 [Octopus bimaculoides]XP_052826021.1 carbonyl reductase [NADPH] 1 isoform X2 [Octopus bimaculoides]|eukprot:XP_014770353.1 PREDICTED: carbonyl reductase [NADPH] 1-like [Octopus bimaculoides]
MVQVAVVTGSNKGIGYAIVRALCKKFKGDVIATARDAGRGETAIAELSKEGCQAKFHQLDITDTKSISAFANYLKETYGGLDILVNNAGIAYKQASTAPFTEQTEVTVRCNFTGTLNVCQQIFPLLRPHARVVNVSSMVSTMSLEKCSKELREKFTAADLTVPQLENLMAQFVTDVKNGDHAAKGWPSSAYGVSKMGVTAMSIIQQKDIDSEGKEDIVVNACCPGYVDTDMTSHKGHKTIDEGADTPVYLALLPPNVKEPRGNYVSERQIHEWK